ncbi:hypothetical protein M8Z33_38230 [Streptomyces sp. ZAF1911]|uniref:hypothetical protein n=1 Tax=Streptomyces sp. ZAF1911 TaxID=2944129 RepID=UPI00237C4A8C|nr:hypothetical protein [Streptomyces sp. ZAF1911]MDD9382386.1 hypothetical protein [Streptomyces sp. ZAF1911]
MPRPPGAAEPDTCAGRAADTAAGAECRAGACAERWDWDWDWDWDWAERWAAAWPGAWAEW